MSTQPPKHISGAARRSAPPCRGPTPPASACAAATGATRRSRRRARSSTRSRRGEWEVAAQLVDYWMEEAKVVYVIYRVWDEGFVAFLTARACPRRRSRPRSSASARCSRSPTAARSRRRRAGMPSPAGAGLLGNRLRAFEITAADAARGARRAPRGLATAARPRRRLPGRDAHVRRAPLRRGRDRGGVLLRARSLPPGALPAVRHSRDAVRRDALSQPLPLVRGDARPPRRAGPDGRHGGRRARRPLRHQLRSRAARAGDSSAETRSRARPRGPSRPTASASRPEKHDWAWNEKGVCYYCAHCCFALEHWPARQWGHPLRVIDSPLYPDETSGPEPEAVHVDDLQVHRCDPGRGVHADRAREAGVGRLRARGV